MSKVTLKDHPELIEPEEYEELVAGEIDED